MFDSEGGIPSTTFNSAYFVGGFGGALAGRCVFGDGTGYGYRWARRNAGVYTDVMTLLDGGNLTILGNGSSPNWISTSDATLKDAIRAKAADPKLADALEWSEWEWLSTGETDQGVIAQRLLEQGLGRFVFTDAGGKYAVNYTKMACEAVIGLSARVRELEER